MTVRISALLLVEGTRPAEGNGAGFTPEQKPRRAFKGAASGLILIHFKGPRNGAFALKFYPWPRKKDYRL